ncbi:MAG TPA: hypothetical protein VIM36_09720, partial [Gemmatimonadaceae bacterium]
YEEGVLESIFGREYLDYKNETPRWIPRPPKFPPPPGEYHWAEAFKSEISTFLQYAVLLLAFWIKSKLLECPVGKTSCFAWGSSGFSLLFK